MNDSLFYHIALSMIYSDRYKLAKAGLHDVESIQAICETLHVDRNRRSEMDDAYRKAEKELRFMQQHGVEAVCIEQSHYPTALQSIPDAPLVLYWQGQDWTRWNHKLAFVGTRKASLYGLTATEQLIQEVSVAHAETCIVSGLAYGIDVAAHKAALKEGLPTIAILAHGLQEIYPKVHGNYAERIREKGALVTEYPWGTPPLAWRFLNRNRLIAGMSSACVVVESAPKGGSMSTAKQALDYGRDVYACPGRINDYHSKGCHQLIKNQIAQLIESGSELTDALGWTSADPDKTDRQLSLFEALNPLQTRIVEILPMGDSMHLDQLCIHTGLSPAAMMSEVFDLEQKGMIRSLSGGFFTRASGK
ncbi:MAG: DNA-processing protein DprA [Bacteroidales bacterium]|nr:DNA-processing protein DprA [Bacteroidales bacterium]MDD4770927.1 DNA-processing protein DprA [Bacteroidales bacterium]